MERQIASDEIASDDFIGGVIKRKANRLIRSRRFREDDRTGLIQDLYAQVIKSWQYFDPNEGNYKPFVIAVVERQAASMIRELKAKKRDVSPIVSLSAKVEMEGRSIDLAQTISDRDQDRRLSRTNRTSESDLVDLVHDVKSVSADLTSELLDIVERLKTQSVSEILHETGMSRVTFNRRLGLIREHFERFGFNDIF